MEDTPRQISVSRDALRADLGDLRDELKDYIRESLETKANADVVAQLAARVDLHESGVFPPAWELRVKTMINEGIDASTALASQGRYRITSLMVTMVGSTAAILGAILYAVVH